MSRQQRKVICVLPAAGDREPVEVVLNEDDTAGDVLRKVGADSSCGLSRDGTFKALVPSHQRIYPMVETDHEAWWYTPVPEFGSGPGVVRPPVRTLPFHIRQGWVQVRPNLYRGVFRTRRGRYLGEVEIFPGYGLWIFIYRPPRHVADHPCFEAMGKGWYKGDFVSPRSVSVGDAILRMCVLIDQEE